MNPITVHQALTLIAWFALASLLLILLLIARFYQNVSGERTHFWVFGIAVVLFGIAAARYAFVDRTGGDPLGDLLSLAAGVVLAGMCIYLYNLMTAGR